VSCCRRILLVWKVYTDLCLTLVTVPPSLCQLTICQEAIQSIWAIPSVTYITDCYRALRLTTRWMPTLYAHYQNQVIAVTANQRLRKYDVPLLGFDRNFLSIINNCGPHIVSELGIPDDTRDDKGNWLVGFWIVLSTSLVGFKSLLIKRYWTLSRFCTW